MTIGLSATGFQAATLEELLADLHAALLSDVDAELDLDPDQPQGQITAIFANKLIEVWELLDSAYGAFDESKAMDSLLDAICALTGTYRRLAAKGKVTVACTLVSGTVVPSTAAVHKPGDPNTKWILDDTVYPLGFTAPSTATHNLVFRCERTGPIALTSGTLVIATPVSGWSNANAIADAEQGTNREENEELRLRRRAELADLGQCTGPSLRAALLKVPGVISARVFQNRTTLFDADGVPPKAFEAVIWDGTTTDALNATLIKTVYENKPGGIQSFGSTSGTLTDEFGDEEIEYFSRATQVPVSVGLIAYYNAETFPTDGEDQIKAAIAALNGKLDFGDDARLGKVSAAAMSVTGMEDVGGLTLNGLAANVAVGPRQIAVFDTGSISITLVEST